MATLKELINTLPQVGTVDWIGIRPGREEPVVEPDRVEADATDGLVGDRYGKAGGDRQVTLIQAEHLAAVASMLGIDALDPAVPRRNIVVSGLNLLALKDKQFQIGEAVLEYTGLCHPCSKMETALGPGGYNALRGHGGITARILSSGSIALGDEVRALTNEGQT